MATNKNKVTPPATPKQEEEPVVNTQPDSKPERLFILGETAVNTIFQTLQELPYKVASPLIEFLKTNLQEVRPDQVRKEGGK
jgi:hypothetical protein